MKPRGTSSWGNCRRKKKKWGKCLFRESRRRRLNSRRQRKRYRSQCCRPRAGNSLINSYMTSLCLSSRPSATWEIWPFEEASPGREKEAGGEEKVSRRRAQHVQTEKDCRRALAKPSTAGRGLHHAQKGQGEEKVSIFLLLLCLPAICFESRLRRSLVESGSENCWFSDSGMVWARQRFTFRAVLKLFQRNRIHGNYSKLIKFAPGRFRILICLADILYRVALSPPHYSAHYQVEVADVWVLTTRRYWSPSWYAGKTHKNRPVYSRLYLSHLQTLWWEKKPQRLKIDLWRK